MKYNNLVIDTNNLFWRCAYKSLEKFIEVEGHQIYPDLIGSFLSRVNQLWKEFGYQDETILYFLFDNPLSQINLRQVLTDGKYKHSRKLKELPKDIYKSLNIIHDILKNYSNNFRLVQKDDVEADDLTYPVKNYIKQEETTLFISADLDWSKNIGNIEGNKISHWYNYFSIYDIETFKLKYKFEPINKKVQLWKAIRGDNSDCIPKGVPYLPEQVLIEILDKCNDVEDLYLYIKESKEFPDKWKIKIRENEDQVRSNFEIIDFLPIKENIEKYMIKGKENIKMLRYWYDKIGLPYEVRMISKENFLSKKKFKKRVIIKEDE